MMTAQVHSSNAATPPSIVRLAPDYVAVRGAACEGQRADTISRQRVDELVELVRQSAPRKAPRSLWPTC